MIEVYYMEDDENIATAVKEYLCRKGYEVFTFRTLESGKKALEHHIPSLALIDWNMPDGETTFADGYVPDGKNFP